MASGSPGDSVVRLLTMCQRNRWDWERMFRHAQVWFTLFSSDDVGCGPQKTKLSLVQSL